MYNSEAIQAEETSSGHDLSSGNAIFLQPLKFDEDVMLHFPAPKSGF